jgi:hypothetical protein
MIKKIYLILVTLTWLLSSCNFDREKEHFKALVNDSATSLIIYDINIIDVTNGNILPNKTIFIKGDSIAKITDTYPFEDNIDSLRLVNGSSKYIIPGLWDMHVHTYGYKSFKQLEIPLYIAFGVTGIREMLGDAVDLKLKDSINQGTLLGPKMRVGQFVNGYSHYTNTPQDLIITNKDQVNTTIDSLFRLGFDFIKTYDNIKEDVYKAIHKKAAELDFEVSGHIPLTVKTQDAIQLGHKTIEHAMGLELGSSYKEDSLRSEYSLMLRSIDSTSTMEEEIAIFRRSEVDAITSIDLEKRNALFQSLAEKELWVVPTYIYQYLVSYPNANSIVNSTAMQYLPKSRINFEEVKEMWNPTGKLEATIAYRLSYLKDMQDAGVGILAGTDTPFGFSLHHELFLFVEHGLTPLQALQTATINSAKYLNQSDVLGSVEDGKIADLIILNENPLIDIHNISDINSVVLNGKLFDREKLNEMLSDVKEIVDKMN